MPLQALIGYTAAQSLYEVPPVMPILWAVGGVGLAITTVFTLLQIVTDMVLTCRTVQAEGRVITPLQVRLTRFIVSMPLPMALIAYTCLFLPIYVYIVDLALAVASSGIMAALTFYMLLALGEPPDTLMLVKALPRHRWWCGLPCGGFADPLCCLGWCFSPRARKLTLGDLRAAYHMVMLWAAVFMLSSLWDYLVATFPSEIALHSDGFCQTSADAWTSGSWMVVLGIARLLATLAGMSGFTVVVGTVSLALGESIHDNSGPFKAGRKGLAPQLYMTLPMLKGVLGNIPLTYHTPVVHIIQPLNYTEVYGVWNATGRVVSCPVYDPEVMTSMLYCTTIPVFMALLSWSNWQLFPPADTTAELLRASSRVQAERSIGAEAGESPDSSETDAPDGEGSCLA